MFHGTIAATTPTGSRRMCRSDPKKPGRVSCHGYFSATIAERAHHHLRQRHLGPLGERDRRADLGGDHLGHLGLAFAVQLGKSAHGVDSFAGPRAAAMDRCRRRPEPR